MHALIVDAQLMELRATEEIHQRFTELSVEGAGPTEVVHQAAQLSGCPVVLENLARRVLAFDAAGDRAELLLDEWEQHRQAGTARGAGTRRRGPHRLRPGRGLAHHHRRRAGAGLGPADDALARVLGGGAGTGRGPAHRPRRAWSSCWSGPRRPWPWAG